MSDALAAPPREQGWTRIVIALVAFLLLSHAPVVRAAAPVVDTLLLLVPALAARCIADRRCVRAGVPAAQYGGARALGGVVSRCSLRSRSAGLGGTQGDRAA